MKSLFLFSIGVFVGYGVYKANELSKLSDEELDYRLLYNVVNTYIHKNYGG